VSLYFKTEPVTNWQFFYITKRDYSGDNKTINTHSDFRRNILYLFKMENCHKLQFKFSGHHPIKRKEVLYIFEVEK
jgi:hypothetical protein